MWLVLGIGKVKFETFCMDALSIAHIDSPVLVGEFHSGPCNSGIDPAGEPEFLALGRGPGNFDTFRPTANLAAKRALSEALEDGFTAEHPVHYRFQHLYLQCPTIGLRHQYGSGQCHDPHFYRADRLAGVR